MGVRAGLTSAGDEFQPSMTESEYRTCPTVEKQQHSPNSIPFMTSTIQTINTCPKSFGTTNISGNSSVLQGDVYISSAVLNFDCKHTRTHRLTHCPVSSVWKLENHNSGISRTRIQRGGRFQLMPYITLTRKTVTRANGKSGESSLIIIIDILRLCLLTLGLAFHSSGLTLLKPRLQNIVPDDAPFMLACKRGDIITMRSLISKQQAGYSDVTKDNLSPLYFALESGVTAAVEEVVNNCLEIDATFGTNQTSGLAWALYHRNLNAVRFILAKDADLEHISLLGWAPIFYIWRDQTELQGSSLELLQMLQTCDPRVFRRPFAELVDIGEMTLLQRMAILGTPDEVQWLLDCGADIHLRTGQLEWTAMFHAAYDGRLENLRVLGQNALDSVIQDRDLRGWSLLHVAAAEGQTNVIEWLLESGADPYAKSRPTFIDVPESLYGLECTPADVARAEGVEKEEAY